MDEEPKTGKKTAEDKDLERFLPQWIWNGKQVEKDLINRNQIETFLCELIKRRQAFDLKNTTMLKTHQQKTLVTRA
jgi:hypothetical protein